MIVILEVWGNIIAILNCPDAIGVRSWIPSHKIKRNRNLYLVFTEKSYSSSSHIRCLSYVGPLATLAR